jgi:hypothetical protein
MPFALHSRRLFVVSALYVRSSPSIFLTSQLWSYSAFLSSPTCSSDLLWTRREVRRLAVSETAKKYATQFLWSCIFFSMMLSGFVLSSTDFIRMFGAVFWSVITGVAIYPVLRDTKRLADVAASSQTTHANGCGSN